MPLMQSKSKKAFSKNLETEMNEGKPKSQSLAIAYSVKRKPKKKMAEGGPVSAKTEKRPMPDQMDNDAKQANMASDKPPHNDRVTGQPERKQASKGMKTTPIKHPKMVPSSVMSTRLMSREDMLQSSAGTNEGPQEQPPQEDNEMDAKKSGPDVPALHMKRMAKGGMINKAVSMDSAEEDQDQHPAGLEEDNDEMSPSEDEYMANHFATGGQVDDAPQAMESRPDKGWGAIIVGGSGKPKGAMAEGGEVNDSNDQPDDEELLEHHASVVAAIMAKRRKDSMSADSDSDIDHQMMMAEGGEVDLDENSMEQPNGYYHQNEDAALKENYDSDFNDLSQPEDSNEHADSRESDSENEHDSSIVNRIMKKRKSSAISR